MEHVDKVKLVLDKFLEAGLRPNWEKCKFLYSELDCFGHIVTKNGVRIDLAEPLIRLTRKDVPWRWTAKEEEALESLSE